MVFKAMLLLHVVAALLCADSAYANDKVDKIIVFTNHNHTIFAPKALYDNGTITIYNVDTFIDAESSLNTLLEAQAKKQTTPSIYASMNEKQLMSLYQNAYHAISKRPQYKAIVGQLESSSLSLIQLIAYDIKALPAVVINDKAVIYGHNNIGDALTVFNQYSGVNKQ